MRWPDTLLATALAAAAALPAGAADAPLFRHRAPIVVEQHAAFVRLPLPPSAYARSAQPALQDLRVVDARGARVPFALLAPRPDETRLAETARDTVLYELPPRPADAAAAWPSPVDVLVDGDRITVRRRSGATGGTTATPSPGWLVDLGEHPRDRPAVQSLRLQWSGPAEFSAAYALEASDDLRQWRPAGGGQVMALASPGGPLTQPSVPLPAPAPRFVRLVWRDVAAAPRLTGAQAIAAVPQQVSLDPPVEIVLAPVEVPAGAADADTARSLTFDLGATLPLVSVALQLEGGTQVVPLRLQARNRSDEAWQPLAATVAYRIERDGGSVTAPPLPLARSARQLRLVVDERAAPPAAAQTRLRVQAQLAGLVFAAQGQAPYALLAGSRDASPGALPLATLVPAPDDERSRYGRASLGAWSEVDAVARAEEARERRAALRPWLLWAVLVAGVAVLALMVWRLARRGPAQRPG
jgi:hypothetical protein